MNVLTPTEQDLLANGFIPTTYEGQDGVFHVKTGKVEDFPYAKEHIVDEDYVFSSSVAMMSVFIPRNEIQFYIPDSDYVEGPFDIQSDEGQGLVKEAFAAHV